MTVHAMVLMRKEAALQGLTGVKVWDCGVRCYDKQFINAGGADVEGQYVDTLFLPFYSKADQKANPMLANFVKYVGAGQARRLRHVRVGGGPRLPRRGERAGEGGRRQQRHPQDDLRAAEQDPQVRRRRHVRPDRPRWSSDLELQRHPAGEERRLRAGRARRSRARSSAGRTGSSSASSTCSAPADPRRSRSKRTTRCPLLREGAPSRPDAVRTRRDASDGRQRRADLAPCLVAPRAPALCCGPKPDDPSD